MASLPFNDEVVRTLAAILTETGLTEIEIEGKEGRIRVARTPAAVSASVPIPPRPRSRCRRRWTRRCIRGR
jgi:acetyl-CoA carboxylase biotin carboxyl carrier protein